MSRDSGHVEGSKDSGIFTMFGVSDLDGIRRTAMMIAIVYLDMMMRMN